MPYSALPDRRIPYDIDGTVVGYNYSTSSGATNSSINTILGYLNQTQLNYLNDELISTDPNYLNNHYSNTTWFLFPEKKNVTNGIVWLSKGTNSYSFTIQGSANTTNGLDGTWETPTFPDGGIDATWNTSSDQWRTTIRRIVFTQSVISIRIITYSSPGVANNPVNHIYKIHWYGTKASGETPDDLIFTNTSGIELTADADFGDVIAGNYSSVYQFKVKNVSTTKTAYGVLLSCSGSELSISANGTNYLSSLNLGNLSPGSFTPVIYARSLVPAVSSVIGPRSPRVVAVPAYWA